MARSALALLRDPAVTTAWAGPSALPEFSVGGLAGHLAYQVLSLPEALAAPVPTEPVVPVLEHYARVAWIGADRDAEINVRIRDGGESLAANGPSDLADRLATAIGALARLLAETDRPVRIPLWGPWSLTLDDMLLTRLMELAVHADDLAVSVGVPTPPLPPAVQEAVVDLLSRLAMRRHGAVAVVRALARAERAPATIAAF
ncbi:maleylpyruvate isomerase N-terminal domain-containing protein [Labedaea rhizosphaerae]|uniref:Mycothiol maleylpyruvate isomerase-like protein n=1 Tax=Labedaea rhizosphaerae TaxID=598644 RepID=A0A4R6SGI6_LABRH|nr:maleylpyruvate isomerase N-terminal domain-containing protein [Labedaea rhizosphaerae]TDQ00824.1 mycothiol maleylpyruvate isomerase-like protein [Labedaea rhizosphaerae]